MGNPFIWIWLVLTIILIIFEVCTTGLTSIWFAAGGVVAFILSLLKAPIWAQIIAFAVVSVLLLIFTRPLVQKVLKVGENKTNLDSLIGKSAKVITEIDNNKGTGNAVVNGQEWTARSADDSEIIPEGTIVEVVNITGVKLIVKKNND